MASTLQSLMKRKSLPPGFGGFLDSVRVATNAPNSQNGRTEKDMTEARKKLFDAGCQVMKANNMTESSGIYGGYTVPPDFSLAIATSYEENAILYPRATVVPMLSRETTLPRPEAETAQAAGVPNWWGGMSFSWGTGATSKITQTNPTLAQNKLTAQNLIGYITMSRDMAMDMGPGGEDWFFDMFARGSAWNEEYAFFQGLGGSQNQPAGIVGNHGTYAVTRSGGNAFVIADAEGMAAGMTPLGWTRAIWVCNPTVLKKVIALTGFIPNQNGFDTIGVSACGSLFGRPLFVTDKLPALGTPGDILFIDPSMYLIGERAELIVQVSEEFLFTTNQVVYRVWRRVDGQPIFSQVLTLADGATKVSPMVSLTT